MGQFVANEQKRGKTRTLFIQLRDAILAGQLKAGDKLPPSRKLAAERGLSRHTVTTVYHQLAAEGYIEGRAGVGSFVSPGLTTAQPTLKPSAITTRKTFATPEMFLPVDRSVSRFNLRTGRPDPALFPLVGWRRSMTTALQVVPDEFPPLAGLESLRRAISIRIAFSRGVEADINQILVTSGAQQALDVTVRLLTKPGDIVAVEEPGYPPAVRLFEASGLVVTPVPVDEEGLVVDQLPSDAQMVYTTPSHQSPTGTTMTLKRRQALLAFADTNEIAILEDDYDSDYRHSDRPLDPLHKLDPSGRVIYIGTFSKVLSPALRLGFAVFPPSLASAAFTMRSLMDWQPPIQMQNALSRFITDGYLDRHIRQTRKIYTQRHEVVSSFVANLHDEGLIASAPRSFAGLHISGFLSSGMVGRRVEEQARNNGVELSSFADCWHGPVTAEGIMIGFGGVALDQLDEALSILRNSLRCEHKLTRL